MFILGNALGSSVSGAMPVAEKQDTVSFGYKVEIITSKIEHLEVLQHADELLVLDKVLQYSLATQEGAYVWFRDLSTDGVTVKVDNFTALAAKWPGSCIIERVDGMVSFRAIAVAEQSEEPLTQGVTGEVLDLERCPPVAAYGGACGYELLEESCGHLIVVRNRATWRGIQQVSVSAVDFVFSLMKYAKSAVSVVYHRAFEKHLDEFVQALLSPGKCHRQKLFEFNDGDAAQVVNHSHVQACLKALENDDPECLRGLFLQAASIGYKQLLLTLVENHKAFFESEGGALIQEIVPRIWRQEFGEAILAIFYTHSTKLDDYHRLLAAVVMRREPDDEFLRQFALLNDRQQGLLCEAAFLYGNPYLHALPEQAVGADRYSINVMWINRDRLPAGQKYIFEQESAFYKKFLDPLAAWALKHPKGVLNLWYDGEMASEKVVQVSQLAVKNELRDCAAADVVFRDVRTIELVRTHAHAFTKDVPIYLRVDLLRAIVMDHMLRQQEKQFLVYADMDMRPMSAEELFDVHTLMRLADLGFVMAKAIDHMLKGGYENGFQICNSAHQHFMHSHRRVIIDDTLELMLKESIENEEHVFGSYPAMLAHLLNSDGRYGKIDVSKMVESWQAVSPNVDVSNRLDLDSCALNAAHALPLAGMNISEIMPTKPVPLPPSHYCGGASYI